MKKSIALAVSGMALAASVVGLSTTNASAYAACGSSAPSDLDHSTYVTANTSVNIRTGSDINCTSIGILAAGTKADYYCYTLNQASGHTWTYLRDVATGKKGWVRDDNLPGVGSLVYCGF